MIKNILSFYIQGFTSMRVGKKLWTIIFIKLFVMFVVLKIFFFPNYLEKNFNTDEERANHVLQQIIHTTKGGKNG